MELLTLRGTLCSALPLCAPWRLCLHVFVPQVSLLGTYTNPALRSGAYSLMGQTDHRQTRRTNMPSLVGQGSRHRRGSGGGSGMASPHGDRAGREAGICGNSTCKSPGVGIRLLCLGRRPVWLEPGGQGERVAGAVGEMGRGRWVVLPSGRARAQSGGRGCGRRPFRLACIHSSSFIHAFTSSCIIHSFTLSFIHSPFIPIHSFFIYYSFICHPFIILHSFTRHFVSDAACEGMSQTPPRLP